MSAVEGARQKEALHKSSTSQSHSLQNSFPDSVWNQTVYLKSIISVLGLYWNMGPAVLGEKNSTKSIVILFCSQQSS